MKIPFVISTLFIATAAFAQSPPPAMSPEVQQIMSQLNQVGCQAQSITAAQTIANLQKQVTQLQDQLKKADPPPPKPVSGATKH